MWNLGRGNLFSWCVWGLLLNKIQALADMNTLGRFSLEVAQEDCDDLNLLCTHCHHCVSEVVLDHEIEERLSNEICSCCWHQIAWSHQVAMSQLVCGDVSEVLG